MFQTTHWSVVIGAAHGESPEQALETLCRQYWYPLYAFVRRSGHGPDDAADLTQEFFSRLLEKHWLTAADPARGRFRTFLIAALKHFLANEWHRAHRQKRGGGFSFVALDPATAEECYAREPSSPASPDRLYDRRWALTLLERTQARLREEMTAAGAADRFLALEPTLVGDRTDLGYADLAKRFGVAEATVKSMVLRLRRRFRELVREEVAHTTGDAAEVEVELTHLLSVLRG